MTTARLFSSDKSEKKILTADELLDALRDNCANRAEREAMLDDLAVTAEGMMVVVKAHTALLSAYLSYQRLAPQLEPYVDMRAEHKFNVPLTIEIIHELNTCLGRFLTNERNKVLAYDDQSKLDLKV